MFIPRIVKPIENESLIVNDCYFNATNNGYYPNYQMPNCTCYALGRALEIAKQNNIPLVLRKCYALYKNIRKG